MSGNSATVIVLFVLEFNACERHVLRPFHYSKASFSRFGRLFGVKNVTTRDEAWGTFEVDRQVVVCYGPGFGIPVLGFRNGQRFRGGLVLKAYIL